MLQTPYSTPILTFCGFGTHAVSIGGTVQRDGVDVKRAVPIMTAPVKGTARLRSFGRGSLGTYNDLQWGGYHCSESGL